MKVVFLICFLVLVGCSSHNSAINSGPTTTAFDKSYSAYDIKVVWKTEKINNYIKIHGIVKNNYVYPIRNLEILARGFDNNGTIICTGNYDFFPEEIATGEEKLFSIFFKCPKQVDKITFFYRHYFKGDKDMRDLNFGSFE